MQSKANYCPDMTYYNGKLINSCRMDEYRLFGTSSSSWSSTTRKKFLFDRLTLNYIKSRISCAEIRLFVLLNLFAFSEIVTE